MMLPLSEVGSKERERDRETHRETDREMHVTEYVFSVASWRNFSMFEKTIAKTGFLIFYIKIVIYIYYV